MYNKIITCIFIIARYPLLLSFIITIIYSILSLYFYNHITYCDSTGLEELKDNLLSECDKYYKALDEYKHTDYLLSQAKNRPEKNNDIIQYLTNKTNEKYSVYHNHLWNIINIRNDIIKIEPTYRYTIKRYYLS